MLSLTDLKMIVKFHIDNRNYTEYQETDIIYKKEFRTIEMQNHIDPILDCEFIRSEKTRKNYSNSSPDREKDEDQYILFVKNNLETSNQLKKQEIIVRDKIIKEFVKNEWIPRRGVMKEESDSFVMSMEEEKQSDDGEMIFEKNIESSGRQAEFIKRH